MAPAKRRRSVNRQLNGHEDLQDGSNVRDHKYAVHQCALITRFQPLPKPHSPLDSDAEVACPARILEIRALDAKNVYIRLYWLYTPEQLPNGRQPYHGKGELIATNHMEIVDAARVVESLAIVHWKDEKQEPSGRLNDGENYWRQTYHILSQELSVSLSGIDLCLYTSVL
ncbi:MAG: hypothetical protein Q9209_007093 [Squamulea sp. 1 TL-2023]